MGDAGEGLVDAESRIQERREEMERERREKSRPETANPESERELESLKLARTELTRQLERTTDERRRQSIAQAIEEVDRRMGSVKPA
jgi:hypothetical protein